MEGFHDIFCIFVVKNLPVIPECQSKSCMCIIITNAFLTPDLSLTLNRKAIIFSPFQDSTCCLATSLQNPRSHSILGIQFSVFWPICLWVDCKKGWNYTLAFPSRAPVPRYIRLIWSPFWVHMVRKASWNLDSNPCLLDKPRHSTCCDNICVETH